jgi:hypothetical protein
MVTQLMERQASVINTQEAAGVTLMRDEAEILSSRVSRKKLIEFILDSIVIDEAKHQLQISISHLKSRMEDRILLRQYFKVTGGRYLPT